jgi:hypothetical protein
MGHEGVEGSICLWDQCIVVEWVMVPRTLRFLPLHPRFRELVVLAAEAGEVVVVLGVLPYRIPVGRIPGKEACPRELWRQAEQG